MDGGPSSLQMAIADLIEVKGDKSASGILWRGRSDRFKNYGVMFEDMRGKVISAKSLNEPSSTRQDTGTYGRQNIPWIWFVSYGNLSGT